MKLEVADMGSPEELKKIRQNSLLSPKSFAEELGVSYLSVSRWEGGHTKPNWKGMKSIKEFCIKNRINYQAVVEEWVKIGVDLDDSSDDRDHA